MGELASTLARQADRVRRGRWLSAVCLTALFAPAVGCDSLRTGALPENAPWRRRAMPVLELEYKRSLRADSLHVGEPYERGRPAIDMEQYRVFVGSSDGGLYALNARDGSSLWRFQTAGPVQSEPLYDPREDVVYFGSNDGALYKLNAATGKLVWRFATNAEVAQRPELNGDRLLVVNANDTVLALDHASGKLLWSQHRSPALGMEVAGHAGLLVQAGRVYTAFSDGTVTAFDVENGRERWEPVDLTVEAEQVRGEAPQYLDADATPAWTTIDDKEAIVVGAYDGGVFALSADSGNQLWGNMAVTGATDVTVWHQPAHREPDAPGRLGSLYPERHWVVVATGTSGLWALDAETGAEVWRQDLPGGGVQRPVLFQGTLAVATSAQGFFLVAPTDGSIIDGIQADVGFSMAPAVAGHRAFILSNAGVFYSFSVTPPML